MGYVLHLIELSAIAVLSGAVYSLLKSLAMIKGDIITLDEQIESVENQHLDDLDRIANELEKMISRDPVGQTVKMPGRIVVTQLMVKHKEQEDPTVFAGVIVEQGDKIPIRADAIVLVAFHVQFQCTIISLCDGSVIYCEESPGEVRSFMDTVDPQKYTHIPIPDTKGG